MTISQETKDHVLEHSTLRRVVKDFPEFNKFLTGQVDQIKVGIANAIPGQTIDILEEKLQGDLGDIIELYVQLKQEENFEKTFFGIIYRLFVFKRPFYDRNYILSTLKQAMNKLTMHWYSS